MEPAHRCPAAKVLNVGDDASLRTAIRAAVAPHGLVERVKLGISGGWTARQVYERLGSAEKASLVGTSTVSSGSQESQRAGVDRVYRVLLELSDAGELRRKKVQYTMTLNTKGPRDMLVDVFR